MTVIDDKSSMYQEKRPYVITQANVSVMGRKPVVVEATRTSKKKRYSLLGLHVLCEPVLWYKISAAIWIVLAKKH